MPRLSVYKKNAARWTIQKSTFKSRNVSINNEEESLPGPGSYDPNFS